MIAGNIQEQPFYKKYVKIYYDLPETEKVHQCGFYSGNYPDLTEMDLQTISKCLQRS
jgi:CDP-6-deoxy-D-xylo-4-hexulose-3-dehydrase